MPSLSLASEIKRECGEKVKGFFFFSSNSKKDQTLALSHGVVLERKEQSVIAGILFFLSYQHGFRCISLPEALSLPVIAV